jgi:hypothetical protein
VVKVPIVAMLIAAGTALPAPARSQVSVKCQYRPAAARHRRATRTSAGPSVAGLLRAVIRSGPVLL